MDDLTITVEVGFDKQEIHSFEELVSSAYELAMGFGRKIVSRALEARDQELMQARDRRRYRSKGKQQTSIKTKLGAIEYSRNVYVDNAASDGIKCVHLLDEELGIEKIGLIAREMCELAAESASESTYRAAARTITETTGLSISHQSVWNIVQKL